MSELDRLIDDDQIGIPAIAAYLDGLDGATRWREVSALGRARQRMLYEKAAHARPIDLAHFVGDAGEREEVIHEGVNTLPVPAPLRRFQKRFCRPSPPPRGGAADISETGATPNGHGPRLFGYNEGPTRKVVGPGFFVAIPTDGRPHWTARGPVVVDYFQVPDGPVADGWPAVVPNDWRLQRFVYNGTRDFMRKVSAHVSIGAAFKGERPLDHYFVLCRKG